MNKTDTAFLLQLRGYSLATAEIIYRRPDFLDILQTYIWQDYDVVPEFPVLTDFLRFWQCELDGPLVKVTVVSRKLIKPSEIRLVDGEFSLN